MSVFFKVAELSDVVNNAANSKRPNRVFGDYVFEGDLHILAGSSNNGKTILSTDIAIIAAGGINSWDDDDMCELEDVQTLFIDFEMSDNQLFNRYNTSQAVIPKGIVRASLKSDGYSASLDKRLNEIRLLAQQQRPQLIIIDNLSSLLGGAFSRKIVEKALSSLKRLKEEYDCTMVVVAHLKKRLNNKPIEIDDIYGSSAIVNIADSISVIGSDANDRNVKYLKMLKSRSIGILDEVAVIHIESSPYIHFQFDRRGYEEDFLSKVVSSSKTWISEEMKERILELRDKNLSVREIAAETGCSKSSVGRFLQKAAEKF